MGKLAALVPELYYDLIARLVPGGIGLVLVSASLPPALLEKLPGNEPATILAVVAAYAMGLLLDAGSGITIGPINALVRRAWAFVPILRNRPVRALDDLDPWAFMRGGAKPSASAVVGKLVAERTCLHSFTFLCAVGWLTDSLRVGVIGTLGSAVVTTGVAVAQYRWDYLARVTRSPVSSG
jgi:hypothetical protein